MIYMKTVEHEFYCLKCGKKGLPVLRKQGYQKEKFHRKKLYCIHCHEEVNHIEVKNPIERQEFLTNFTKGDYQDEAKNSLAYVRSTRIW